mgnify:FL=1
MERYLKYEGFPYRHLGDSSTSGIDCFNLIRLVYKEELGIDIPLSTSSFCYDQSEQWYSKTNSPLFSKQSAEKVGFKSVKIPKEYDVIVMSIGTTNVANHCALYLGKDKILQTMIGHNSWIAPYGRYYKQYTVDIYRWHQF